MRTRAYAAVKSVHALTPIISTPQTILAVVTDRDAGAAGVYHRRKAEHGTNLTCQRSHLNQVIILLSSKNSTAQLPPQSCREKSPISSSSSRSPAGKMQSVRPDKSDTNAHTYTHIHTHRYKIKTPTLEKHNETLNVAYIPTQAQNNCHALPSPITRLPPSITPSAQPQSENKNIKTNKKKDPSKSSESLY